VVYQHPKCGDFFYRIGILRTLDGYREECGGIERTESSEESRFFSIIDDDSEPYLTMMRILDSPL
jgi:hypothetical protein